MPAQRPFWVILIGKTATSFRGKEREDLLPTLRQLQRTQTDVTLRWFERGKVWESPAAATGAVGVVRRDPMAMKPFCGYNFADYWAHWLSFEKRSDKLPRIFHVNWFRQDASGDFLWPGFGENLRVLRWIIDRCEGRVSALETPIGFLPNGRDIDTHDLDVTDATMEALLSVNVEQWKSEMESVGEYLQSYGERLPGELRDEHEEIVAALASAG